VLRRRRFREAEELYRVVLELQPSSAAHFALAGALRGRGELAPPPSLLLPLPVSLLYTPSGRRGA
jgi:hypothetical protein